MELLEGIKLSEPERLAAAGVDGDEVARRGAAICLKMIFDHGFYHADPHPGNLLVMEGCRIGLLGFRHGRPDRRAAARERQRNARRPEQPRRRTHDRDDPAAGQDAGRPGPRRR